MAIDLLQVLIALWITSVRTTPVNSSMVLFLKLFNYLHKLLFIQSAGLGLLEFEDGNKEGINESQFQFTCFICINKF